MATRLHQNLYASLLVGRESAEFFDRASHRAVIDVILYRASSAASVSDPITTSHYPNVRPVAGRHRRGF